MVIRRPLEAEHRQRQMCIRDSGREDDAQEQHCAAGSGHGDHEANLHHSAARSYSVGNLILPSRFLVSR